MVSGCRDTKLIKELHPVFESFIERRVISLVNGDCDVEYHRHLKLLTRQLSHIESEVNKQQSSNTENGVEGYSDFVVKL